VARILVIDDSPEFRKLLEKILQRAEHEAISAEDGDAGIHMAIVEQPDLILLDYMMPEKNGPEVFQELSENDNTATIPVIMITAFSTNYEMDRNVAMRLGMSDFLTKPISPGDLIERVNHLLSKRQTFGPSQAF
jgi:twitching motility two-component system response regulator PilH